MLKNIFDYKLLYLYTTNAMILPFVFFILFCSIYLIICIYILFYALFPIRIEIQGNIAQITKKSIMHPFEYKKVTIPNIKQATIEFKFQKCCRILLEDYNGKTHPISQWYPSKFYCEQLQEEINKAITNKTTLSKTANESGILIKIMALVYTVAGVESLSIDLILFFTFLSAEKTLTLKEMITPRIFLILFLITVLYLILFFIFVIVLYLKQEKEVKRQTYDFNLSSHQQHLNINKNNHNDINNSIIK